MTTQMPSAAWLWQTSNTKTMKPLFMVALWMLLVPSGYAGRTHVAHSGDCVYSFQVWSPDGDVLTKIKDLEHSCRNSSWQMEREFLITKLDLQREMQRIGNVSSSLERALLQQSSEQAQLDFRVKDLRLELLELRNKNDRLRLAYRQLTSSGSNSDLHLILPTVDTTKDTHHLEGSLADNNALLSRLKHGLSDLKGEWIIIKRQLQAVLSGNSQFKMGQDALRDDTVKLKEMIEGLRIDTATLKEEQSRIKLSHDRLRDAVDDADVTEGLDVSSEFHNLKEKMQELSRQVAQLQNREPELKRELVAMALAARNFSAEDIGEWLQTLPGLNSSPLKALQIEAPRDCQDVFLNGHTTSGVYSILPLSGGQRESVYCQLDSDAGWTVVQRRTDGTLSFTRRWLEYKFGFGGLYGEFWLGNELLHALTGNRTYILRVDMWDWEGKRAYAQYKHFRVDSEKHKYRLHVREYSGNAGDSMSAMHDGMAFSTEDSDNDHGRYNCAELNRGGWWYNSCYTSNLNGFYHMGRYPQTFADGIVWYTLKDDAHYSLRKVEMKIRPATARSGDFA